MQTIDLPRFNTPAPKGAPIAPYRTRQEIQAAEVAKFKAWKLEDAKRRPWWMPFKKEA